MKICLMGFMGCGKSTVGLRLSELLGYKLSDTDAVISRKMGISISNIFEDLGEAHFRKLERDTLHICNNIEDVVLSVGGGLPCNKTNINYINNNFFSIYLHLNVNKIVERLSDNEQDSRPLLKNIKSKNELREYVENKLAERERFYFDSALMVDGDQSVEKVTKDILQYLSDNKSIQN